VTGTRSLVLASIADRILVLHGWGAVAVVFALPALEASAFVGFVFPGEIAVLLGGVLASQHKVSLPAVIVAAIAGAVVGDSVGYEIGKRYGRRVLDGTVGRLVRREHLDRAERYLAERGGRAVFLGRFTAALRVLVPGLAGMAGLRYSTFLAYNAAGGALWASGFVLAGYVAGDSWRRVEHAAGRAGVVVLLLIAIGGGVVAGAGWAARNQDRLRRFADRRLGRSWIRRFRDRYRRQLAFVGRRLRPGEARGLSLTIGFAFLVAAGWAFSVITQDVLAGEEAVHLDRPVLDWFVEHREPWLTHTFKIVTTLGTASVLLPAAAVTALVLWRARRTARPALFLGATLAGGEVLFRVVKHLTSRGRPPSALAVGHFGGPAFPSGHATLAAAMWCGMAAALGLVLRTWNRKVAAWSLAILVALAVGITRMYLGAHWLTDVLAGWALGAGWLTATLLVLGPNPRRPPQDPG